MLEHLSHLFYGCIHTKNFFRELKIWLRDIDIKYEISIEKLKILFGIHNEIAMSEKNLILLVAKKFIWVQKFREQTPALAGFKTYLLDFLTNLKYICEIKNDGDNYDESWSRLLEQLQIQRVQDDRADLG